MFGFKKVIIVATSLAALAVPSLALADDYGHRDFRRDDRAVVERLRAEIARDRMELQRDLRAHRWAEARREQRELQMREARLRELLSHRR